MGKGRMGRRCKIQKNMISILTVSYQSPEYLDLLIRSAERYTKNTFEILIWNNSGEVPESSKRHKVFSGSSNIGHGPGMDKLIEKAEGDYICLMDVDAHFVRPNWDGVTLKQLEGYDAIFAKGSDLKPVRPAFGMIKRQTLDDVPELTMAPHNLKGAKFDVGILAYFQLLSAGKRVLKCKMFPNEYPGTWSETYGLGDMPLVSHIWYGTRFAHGKKKIDGRKVEDHLKNMRIVMEANKDL